MTKERSLRKRAADLREVLDSLPKALLLLFQDNPGYTTVMVVATALRGTLPIAVLWVSKLIIDGIAGQAAGYETPWRALEAYAPLILLYLMLILAGEIVGSLAELAEPTMSDRLLARMNLLLMEKTSQLPDLAAFETPEFHDALRNAREGIQTRPLEVLNASLNVLEYGIGCVGFALVLWHLNPAIMFLILGETALTFGFHSSLSNRMEQVFSSQAPDARRLSYLGGLITGDGAAKELRLFALAGHLMAQYRTAPHL